MTLSSYQKMKRLHMIKKASQKYKSKVRRNHRVRATETSHFDKEEPTQNINYYTDESSYADDHYGETLRETTRYDKEWD